MSCYFGNQQNSGTNPIYYVYCIRIIFRELAMPIIPLKRILVYHYDDLATQEIQ